MSRRRSVWWLWPVAPLLLVVGSTLLAANAVAPATYERAWRVPKSIDDATTLVMLAAVVALAVGMLLAGLSERRPGARPDHRWPAMSDEALVLLARIYPYLIGLTVFGYVVWIGMGISRGLTFSDVQTVLATQDNFKLPIKEKLDTLPGVTTLTQVAISAAVVGVILDLHRPSAAIRWAYRFVLLLGAARALMLAERLAVAEILVPIMVLRAAAFGRRSLGSSRVLLNLAPVLGVLFLMAGFAASEYSRSWNWYSDNSDQSFAGFAAERLLGYYATSHNNGALLLQHGTDFAAVPYYTTTFVWEVPPGNQLAADVSDDASADRRRILRDFGNPEFNSPGGLASVFSDYGVPGGLVFYFGTGLLIGAVHLSFLHGRIIGVMLYPLVFTGLLELPRYLYWFQGRTTPAAVVTLAVAAYLATTARRRLHQQDFGPRWLAAPASAIGRGTW